MMLSRSKHRSSLEICADCGNSDPSWASINRGLLLCAECCSVHRSMGRHISHVKSLRQGTWPPSLLAMVQALTAQNVNCIWEHSLLDPTHKHLRKKPQPKDPLHPTKSEFIQAKHLRLAFVLRARRDEPASELGRQLHSAVRSASLDTAMRLLAQGADPNYYHEEKGSTCLHVACRAGQAAQAELLAAWGALCARTDLAGRTPADTARAGGHTELAQRMLELTYEAPDRLACFLRGERASHAGSSPRCLPPRARDALEMTDGAKAARGKLQLLPNHLFEELVMDIYDEIDRRETEAIWQTSAAGLERSGVAFLPVNPALSAPRNQGRQKLARLSLPEIHALIRDVLLDANRRHHIATLHPRGLPASSVDADRVSTMSDDEPLYDSVAEDDDYAALAPPSCQLHTANYHEMSITGSGTSEAASASRSTDSSPKHVPEQIVQIDSLKKELDNRDSTITELKSQLKNLQTIVEQLTKENTVLKTCSDDGTETNGIDGSKQERGKSLEADQMVRSAEETEVRQAVKGQRPVSMFEAREGPKNNWQVTKHQLTTLPVVVGAVSLPDVETVHRRAEQVTRALQELWAAAREPYSRPPQDRAVRQAVAALLALFPQSLVKGSLEMALEGLRTGCEEVTRACSAVPDLTVPSPGVPSPPLADLSAAAYNLAKATKILVTHFADTPTS